MSMDIQPSQSGMTFDICIGVSTDINETYFHEMYLNLHIVNDSS